MPSLASAQRPCERELAAVRDRAPDVRAGVSLDQGRFVIRVELAHGARTMRVASCEEAAEAVLLVAAIARDIATHTLDAPVLAARAPGDLAVSLSVGGALDVGLLPWPAAGVSLGAVIEWDLARIELSALLAPPARREGSQAIEAALYAGALDAYASVVREGPLSLALGGGVEVGALIASGLAVRFPRTSAELVPSLRAGGALGLRLSEGIELRATVLASVPLVRPRFEVERMGMDPEVRHLAEPIALRAALSLVVRLGS